MTLTEARLFLIQTDVSQLRLEGRFERVRPIWNQARQVVADSIREYHTAIASKPDRVMSEEQKQKTSAGMKKSAAKKMKAKKNERN